MLRAVLLFVAIVITAPALAQAPPPAPPQAPANPYADPDLATAAQQWRQQLIDSVPKSARQPDRIAQWKSDAEADFRGRNYALAIAELTRAIASGADDGLTWLRLAQCQYAVESDQVLASAYRAYTIAHDPVERGTALFIIGRDYDRHMKQKAALRAFEAGLTLTSLPPVAERVAQLKRLVAFRVTHVAIAADSAEPSACLTYNEAIDPKADISYGGFVRSAPAVDGVVTVRDHTLCLTGIRHGETYRVEVQPGLPAATGEKTAEAFATRIVVPDRKPSIGFSGTGYVLPSQGGGGLPVTTVNLSQVRIRILRVNQRNLVPSLGADRLTMQFSDDDVDNVLNNSGSLVWQGEMAVSGPRNRAVSTAIPLDMLNGKGPGVYLVAVGRTDAKTDDDTRLATNWVLVSDIGLAAYGGSDALAVDVRSLANGKPLVAVEIRLYARNNGLLGAETSGTDGIVRFAAGLLRGKGGDAPYALMAYGADHDFNFLDISRAAFDLSDRGVSGRPPAGPVDAFLYTDRGIYRPGETVHLTTLVRDDKADAEPGLPLTLRLLRPDGVEVESRRIAGKHPGGSLGAYEATYTLPRDARIGAWQVELRLDPKAPPIGTAEFQVEDFVPPQLKVALSAPDQPILPGTEFAVGIDAHYYYGAPGAGLATQAQATIALADNPYPDYPDYQFGLIDEEYTGDRRDLDGPTTGDDGEASLAVTLDKLPDLTRPLAATISVGVFEPSGRPVDATLTRPIALRNLAIGLRSEAGDDAIAEGQPAKLDVIALDGAGKRVAATALHWELLREDWHYEWYAESGVWRYRRQISDQPIESGTLDVGTDKPAMLARTEPAGRYRWEVGDAASGAQSSVRFHVGWWIAAELPDVPDKLTATLDKPRYKPGDTAKLFIKAPFAGTAELAIASNRIVSLRALDLPAGGTTVEIPVAADWGSGVYALVSAYRPAGAAAPGPQAGGSGAAVPAVLGPGRAVGVAWLGLDPAPRTLAVTLTPPAVARPRHKVEIPVKIAGLAVGEEAYVTIAAVDEAVLKLTDFASPQPEAYYYGKRRLGVELRDLYGRLIDTRASAVGVLRSGGDSFAKRSVAGLPDRSSRVVALFSGLVRLDAQGAATVAFDIPDFEGQLRLMAVAVAAHKVGSASAPMIVRDKVVTTVSLPRFLAPGDSARLGVTIHNLEGAAGDYHLALTAGGAGAVAAPVERTIALATGADFSGAFTLDATTIGDVALRLTLTGPDDLHIVRDFTIGVRPAQAYQLKRFVGQLQPGGSLTLDDSAAGEFLPGTAEALASVSPHPDWDVPGLLRALDRYAYGCIEQTTSRALPLLYVADVARLWNTDPGFSPKATLVKAIGHIAEMQRSDGSFGVWSSDDDTVPWLDAYATDFLMRAQEHGNAVPGFVLKAALDWLRDYTRQGHTQEADLPAAAYAHYVLARAKDDDIGALRYFADTELARLPTQLAKAQLGAALALYGDTQRAAVANAAALEPAGPRPPGLRYVDYGSALRDSAAVLAFVAANPGPKPSLTAAIDHIQELFSRADRTSTQEQAWLLMAAQAAAGAGGGQMTIAENGGAPQTLRDAVYLRRALGSGGPPQTIVNRGTTPVWRAVSITGVDRSDLPAESRGYSVSRNVFRPDGAPADLAKARQTDLYVVVLEATRTDASQAAQALVVDLLPAGFEIETVAVSKGTGAGAYPFLPDLSTTRYAEARDDRYVAALDLPRGTKSLALAYVVRAVTPGAFKYPALVVEDMYDPATTGRTAIGQLVVTPR